MQTVNSKRSAMTVYAQSYLFGNGIDQLLNRMSKAEAANIVRTTLNSLTVLSKNGKLASLPAGIDKFRTDVEAKLNSVVHAAEVDRGGYVEQTCLTRTSGFPKVNDIPQSDGKMVRFCGHCKSTSDHYFKLQGKRLRCLLCSYESTAGDDTPRNPSN